MQLVVSMAECCERLWILLLKAGPPAAIFARSSPIPLHSTTALRRSFKLPPPAQERSAVEGHVATRARRGPFGQDSSAPCPDDSDFIMDLSI